ncbi:MAG: hypothetical protein WAU86_08325 [Oricola sp.]
MTNLTGDILRILIPGRTHVLERNGGQAFVYLAADGTGHMRLDDGETRSGTWRLTDNGYATEWASGHKGEWVLEETASGLDYISRDGTQRLKMVGVLFGDPERLAAN